MGDLYIVPSLYNDQKKWALALYFFTTKINSLLDHLTLMGKARLEQYTIFKKTAVLSQKLLTYGLSSLYYMFGQDNTHISYGPESPL